VVETQLVDPEEPEETIITKKQAKLKEIWDKSPSLQHPRSLLMLVSKKMNQTFNSQPK